MSSNVESKSKESSKCHCRHDCGCLGLQLPPTREIQSVSNLAKHEKNKYVHPKCTEICRARAGY